MKKILFLVLFCFGLMQLTQAQVIELIGIGIRDVNPGVLVIPDPGSVDHVVIEAAGIFRNNAVPTEVRFWDDNESYEVEFNLTEVDLAPDVVNGASQKWGYYTATFNTVDADGVISLDKLGNVDADEEITSITAYVYRTGGSGIYSEVKGDHAFLYHNGSADPMVYNFTIPVSSGPRDVSVTISFSEVNADGRYSIIDMSAGSLTAHVEFDDNNRGNRLHIETVTLFNVPGDVTEVTVSLYSPDPDVDGKTGDSFITGAVLLTTTFEEGGGCTLTQGYWKNHSDPENKKYDDTWNLVGGPDADFFLSGKTYLEVLNTPVKGNAYYILAHQYIAAELNMLAGAYLGEIMDEFDDATDLLETYTPAQVGAMKGNNPVRALFITLGDILDDFNNGTIGPGHCGEENEIFEKSAVLNDNSPGFRELKVYPNPVKGVATLSFNPNFDGNTTIDLYSATGQKAATLFNQNVRKDVPVSFTFNGHQFTEGLYIARVRNGLSVENLKIQIRK